MTEKEKQLLLQDLCARLPYGVKVQSTFYNCNGTIWKYENEILTIGLLQYPIERYKPYLFPLSSMNEGQIRHIYECYADLDRYEFEVFYKSFLKYYDDVWIGFTSCSSIVDWFNQNHIDYRGLIEKGLANDATGLNIY